MTDTRTTEEKLQAEADTEMRVKTEAALAYLRGRKDQLAADGVGDTTTIGVIRHDVEMLRTLIKTDEVPLPGESLEVILLGLDVLLTALPTS